MKRITYLVTKEQMEDIERVLQGKTKKDFLTDLIVDFLAVNISEGLNVLEIQVDENANEVITFEISDELHTIFKQFAKKLKVNMKDLAYHISTSYLLETHYTDMELDLDIEVVEMSDEELKEEKRKNFYYNLGKKLINNEEDELIQIVIPYLDEVAMRVSLGEFSLVINSHRFYEPNETITDNIKLIYDKLVEKFDNKNISVYELISVIKCIYIIKNRFDF